MKTRIRIMEDVDTGAKTFVPEIKSNWLSRWRGTKRDWYMHSLWFEYEYFETREEASARIEEIINPKEKYKTTYENHIG